VRTRSRMLQSNSGSAGVNGTLDAVDVRLRGRRTRSVRALATFFSADCLGKDDSEIFPESFAASIWKLVINCRDPTSLDTFPSLLQDLHGTFPVPGRRRQAGGHPLPYWRVPGGCPPLRSNGYARHVAGRKLHKNRERVQFLPPGGCPSEHANPARITEDPAMTRRKANNVSSSDPFCHRAGL